MLLQERGKTLEEISDWLDLHILVYNVLNDISEKDPNRYDEDGNIIEEPEEQVENRYLNLDTFDEFVKRLNEDVEPEEETSDSDIDEENTSMIDKLDLMIKRKWGEVIKDNK